MKMAYIKQAPIVLWDYETEKDEGWGTSFYTKFNNNFLYFAMKELSPTQFIVFMLFASVAYGGFKLHKNTALERTNLSKTTYYKTRRELEEMGWITLVDGDNPEIIINTKEIKRQFNIDNDEPIERLIMTDN